MLNTALSDSLEMDHDQIDRIVHLLNDPTFLQTVTNDRAKIMILSLLGIHENLEDSQRDREVETFEVLLKTADTLGKHDRDQSWEFRMQCYSAVVDRLFELYGVTQTLQQFSNFGSEYFSQFF